ncbi:hypothetical protein SAMN05661030_2590 [Klenkia taihuensis]|uniref:Uncharacterized protein n=1 Tax=Klenkia taihuensis TaxID=1225127 RepID=A0A1I1QA25_9ACTN|nr:hypothetical protein SAMN05661030_2590 [Klenkia taihuensis]
MMMHPVPRGRAPDDGSDPIQYSEAAITLGADDKAFIQRRLRHSLGGYARPVREDADLGSQVPTMLKDLLISSDKLVSHSCSIARQLHLEQKWMSSGGLVMTIIGEVDGKRCVMLAKMEHQEGMRVEQTTNSSGQRTYRAEHLRDLILGDGTRVFKIGLFTDAPDDHLEGHVVDDQQLQGGIANYFIQFLGCQFRQQSDVQTEQFFRVAQTFISQRTAKKPEANARYEIALLAEMQKQSTVVQPEVFAAQNLNEEDQELFVQRIRDAGLSSKSFPKDTSLIASKIRRMRIQTERGADVLAPPEMFEDGSLRVEKVDDSKSQIVINDAVTKMSGASGKRSSSEKAQQS